MSVHEVSTPLSRWLFRTWASQERRLRSAGCRGVLADATIRHAVRTPEVQGQTRVQGRCSA